jgi:uncharacterized protein (DUF885 family)
MNRLILTAVLVCGSVFSGEIMTTTVDAQTAAPDTAAAFRSLAGDYFEQVYFRFAPSIGTYSGLHQYDTQLEDYTRAGVDRQVAALKSFETKFDAVSDSGLDESTRGDLAMVRDNIRSTLLQLETIRPWEKNPDNYSSGIAGSAFVLMERKFAPADDRLRSLIAREKQMPAVFTAAKENLKNSPHVYTEIALEQLPYIVSFFEKDVPEAFKDAKDPATIAEFQKTNDAVIASLNSYEHLLKN